MATESTKVPASSVLPPANSGDVHPSVDPVPRSARRFHRVTFLVWSVTVVALSVFFAFGSITVQAGDADGSRQSLVSIWQEFSRNLPEVGHQTLLEVVYAGTIVIAVLASVAGYWLSMRDGAATHVPANGHDSSRPS